MKFKIFGPAVLAAVAFLAFAGTASATTLEVKGVKQSGAVTIQATLVSGASSLIADTVKETANTFTMSSLVMTTASPFTGTTVGGPLTTMSFSGATEGNPTVDALGTFSIERIGTTTNGTVRWTGQKLTVPSVFGMLTCTLSNTDIGTLTGVATGRALLDVNAVLNCTTIGSAIWTATYTVTSPEGLGVTG